VQPEFTSLQPLHKQDARSSYTPNSGYLSKWNGITQATENHAQLHSGCCQKQV